MHRLHCRHRAVVADVHERRGTVRAVVAAGSWYLGGREARGIGRRWQVAGTCVGGEHERGRGTDKLGLEYRQGAAVMA